jgi:hypothetical protein
VFTAYDMFPVDLEILVNNDTDDIVELYKSGVPTEYTYEVNDNLGIIYKSLFDRASKEYVYFLEDDDIMEPQFFAELSKHSSDIYYFNYVPYKVTTNFIRYFDYTKYYINSTKTEFLKSFDNHNFQIGQMCFKKTALPVEAFPVDNNINNDFVIFTRLQGTFKALPVYLYKQTTDGKDNISFKSYNKDPRWIS